ncbi:hypothetical protein MRB53_030028 [Persea americana]|uniref:Uncharacterized protein n=1 Tax=Persea americana TaxID=3435 RepID=A0ACC2KJZ1_PERAE|nr:hypothetical protein MRB53_030028 [Persea americana]
MRRGVEVGEGSGRMDIKVAALCGSLRKASSIEICRESIKGMEMEYVDIEPLPLTNTDLEMGDSFPEVVEAFRRKILESDCILFASPEYNYSVSEKQVPCQRSPKRTSSSPPTRIAAFVIDFFSTTKIDVGKGLGIPTYIYFPSGVTLLGLMLYLPTLDVKVPSEFKDCQGEVQVPGILPMPPQVMMSRFET